LGSELFVVIQHRSLTGAKTLKVDVYSTNSFTLTRSIPINDSYSLWAIVASPLYSCIYTSDVGHEAVHRYNLSSSVLQDWSVGGICWGLSLTSTNNVLATLWGTNQIQEYSPYGVWIRLVSLDSTIVSPYHSIQLSGDRFVVSHTTSSLQHRVCIVDSSGRIVQCYGGFAGSGVGQLNMPRNLAVDGHGNVLVADYGNNRVVLLSPSLTFLGYIPTPGYQLNRPSALLLDQLNNRLYIGEESYTGRIFVLTV